ncbi:MAG TPA: hypothetical protein VIK91_15350, partial [Nannocystis sp.]
MLERVSNRRPGHPRRRCAGVWLVLASCVGGRETATRKRRAVVRGEHDRVDRHERDIGDERPFDLACDDVDERRVEHVESVEYVGREHETKNPDQWAACAGAGGGGADGR